jgi:hypothetical protein
LTRSHHGCPGRAKSAANPASYRIGGTSSVVPGRHATCGASDGATAPPRDDIGEIGDLFNAFDF